MAVSYARDTPVQVQGGLAAATPAELASKADTIITMLPSSPHVHEVTRVGRSYELFPGGIDPHLLPFAGRCTCVSDRDLRMYDCDF